MRELKKGTDLTDLVEVVIVADKDGDKDYYVAVRFKYCDDNGDPISDTTLADDRTLSQWYLRDERLKRAIQSTEEAKVAQALTNGDISEIEAFLEA